MTTLRDPFPPDAVGKLPKGGKELDYVGHAHVTERLLDVDPEWQWEPLAYTGTGHPSFVRNDAGAPVGLWIKLTVCGVTRLGYGSVDAAAFDPVKQLIGDALRNAAMRFGVALDMWKKDEGTTKTTKPAKASTPGPDVPAKPKTLQQLREAIAGQDDVSLKKILDGYKVDRLESLTEKQASAALTVLRNRAQKTPETPPAATPPDPRTGTPSATTNPAASPSLSLPPEAAEKAEEDPMFGEGVGEPSAPQRSHRNQQKVDLDW